MAVTNLNKYLTMGAIEGFAALVAPLTSFSYVVKPGASALNDVVRVPFAQNTSGSSTFTYSAGYNADGNTVTGQTVTMNNLLFQRISLTDSDLSLLNEDALMRVGRQAGFQLAADFCSSSLASVVTAGNYTTTSSYTSTNFTSSNAVVGLDQLANNLKWPDGERTIIASSGLWANLLSNPNVQNAYAFGGTDVVQRAKLSEIFGFNPYKVSFALPNSDTGIAVNPNAILIANGYHSPTDQGSQYMAADQIVVEGTGLTIGFRQFYVPLLATSYRVFDVLGGAGVGNSNALIHIK